MNIWQIMLLDSSTRRYNSSLLHTRRYPDGNYGHKSHSGYHNPGPRYLGISGKKRRGASVHRYRLWTFRPLTFDGPYGLSGCSQRAPDRYQAHCLRIGDRCSIPADYEEIGVFGDVITVIIVWCALISPI